MSRFLPVFILLIISSFFFVPQTLEAKRTFADSYGNLDKVADQTGHEKTTVDDYIPKVITAAFAAVGATFLALMVYAGMKWMLARGNEDNITTARSTLINATIGLIVIVAAYAITSFVTGRLIDNKKPGQGPDLGASYGNEVMGCCLFEVKSGNLGSGTWGSGQMTSSQCGDWKNTSENITKTDWKQEWSVEQCLAEENARNKKANIILP